jgi:hypothetical protein
MILLHNIVEILNLADGDRDTVLLVVALDGRFIGRAAINGDLLRHAVAADRLGQEAFGCLLVALLREEGRVSDMHFTILHAMLMPSSEGEPHDTQCCALPPLSHRLGHEGWQDQSAHLKHDRYEFGLPV